MCWFFFFFNDTATTEIYTLSLHDALPIPSTTPLEAYGDWFRSLARDGRSWRGWIIDCLLRAENPFSEAAQCQDFDQLPTALVVAARQDLQGMGEIAWCDDRRSEERRVGKECRSRWSPYH